MGILIVEDEVNDVENLIVEASNSKPKRYFIQGKFMQSEVKNRNGRIYPRSLLEREANSFNENYIKPNRALGELGHPAGPAINLDRVSHIIREMKQSNNDFVGRAEILDTPFGKIAKNLMDGGAQLGVSTRGVGTVKKMNNEDYVNNDFSLKTIDIVADPSAPDAFVQGIMEGKEWVFADGAWNEREYDRAKKILSEARRTEIESHGIALFKRYLSKLV